MIEVVNGIIKTGSDGSEEKVYGIREFSLDEEFDYGEVRNANNPGYASMIDGQDSWSATLSIDAYADEGSDAASTSLASSQQTLRTMARNRETVSVILQWGDPSANFGDHNYIVIEEESKGKITSLSYEGSFMQDGEVWTFDAEIEGIEGWSEV